MKTLIFNDRNGAEVYLEATYPKRVPDVKICYRDGLLIWNIWTGNRAFIDTDPTNTDEFRWARNEDVAFSRDEKTLHLGEYWGEHSGFYTKQ